MYANRGVLSVPSFFLTMYVRMNIFEFEISLGVLIIFWVNKIRVIFTSYYLISLLQAVNVDCSAFFLFLSFSLLKQPLVRNQLLPHLRRFLPYYFFQKFCQYKSNASESDLTFTQIDSCNQYVTYYFAVTYLRMKIVQLSALLVKDRLHG